MAVPSLTQAKRLASVELDVNADPTSDRTRIAANNSGESKCLGMFRTVALAQ
jgi:hypothetical protein